MTLAYSVTILAALSGMGAAADSTSKCDSGKTELRMDLYTGSVRDADPYFWYGESDACGAGVRRGPRPPAGGAAAPRARSATEVPFETVRGSLVRDAGTAS